MSDAINPPHYRSSPSGIECIEVAEHLGYRLGNALKYIWRAGLKTESPAEDYTKAIWYLDRERIKRTSGDVLAYPIPEAVMHRAYHAIRHEQAGRYEALRAILWAAANSDPSDIVLAIEHVRYLLEGVE